VGLVAQHIEQIGNYHLANGFSAQQVYVFVATGLEQQEAEPEEFEFLEIKRIPISEVEKMILDGTIKDGPTISAYLYLEKYLQK
jgi:ADP-ribose pyrophosphatase